MPHNHSTRRNRQALLGVGAACLTVAMVGALIDGRLLFVFALAAIALAVLGEATGLGERSAVVRWLTGVSALVGLVLGAAVLYTAIVS